MKKKDHPIKKSYLIYFILLIILTGFPGILLFYLPQRTFSENENRYLTTFSPVSIAGFADHTLQENLTKGASDQFWNRDLWVKSATSLRRLAGFKDSGGVYFGKNGYYFEQLLDSQISQNRYESNLRFLEQFALEYDIPVTFLPVPSAGTILQNLLPDHAVLYDDGVLYEKAGSLLRQVSLLDIRNDLILKSRSAQVYYKTDHHWSLEGAYTAYAAFCKKNEIIRKPFSYFSPVCTSQEFYGTLYSKAPLFHVQPDELYILEKIPDASITIDSRKAESLYDYSKLETKDKYGVWFGGNFGKINIRMSASDTGSSSRDIRRLLIFKDSFANSLVPFLMPHFDEIIMLDLRYFNDSLHSLMQERKPSRLLVLYELGNFAQDNNLFKILK